MSKTWKNTQFFFVFNERSETWNQIHYDIDMYCCAWISYKHFDSKNHRKYLRFWWMRVSVRCVFWFYTKHIYFQSQHVIHQGTNILVMLIQLLNVLNTSHTDHNECVLLIFHLMYECCVCAVGRCCANGKSCVWCVEAPPQSGKRT